MLSTSEFKQAENSPLDQFKLSLQPWLNESLYGESSMGGISALEEQWKNLFATNTAEYKDHELAVVSTLFGKVCCRAIDYEKAVRSNKTALELAKAMPLSETRADIYLNLLVSFSRYLTWLHHEELTHQAVQWLRLKDRPTTVNLEQLKKEYEKIVEDFSREYDCKKEAIEILVSEMLNSPAFGYNIALIKEENILDSLNDNISEEELKRSIEAEMESSSNEEQVRRFIELTPNASWQAQAIGRGVFIEKLFHIWEKTETGFVGGDDNIVDESIDNLPDGFKSEYLANKLYEFCSAAGYIDSVNPESYDDASSFIGSTIKHHDYIIKLSPITTPLENQIKYRSLWLESFSRSWMYFNQSRLEKNEDEKWINDSFARFPALENFAGDTYYALAKIHFEASDYEKVIFYCRKALESYSNKPSNEKITTVYSKLIQCYVLLEKPENESEALLLEYYSQYANFDNIDFNQLCQAAGFIYADSRLYGFKKHYFLLAFYCLCMDNTFSENMKIEAKYRVKELTQIINCFKSIYVTENNTSAINALNVLTDFIHDRSPSRIKDFIFNVQIIQNIPVLKLYLFVAEWFKNKVVGKNKSTKLFKDFLTICRWRREGIALMESQNSKIEPLQQLILLDPTVVRELLPTITKLQEKVERYKSSSILAHGVFANTSKGTKRNVDELSEEGRPAKYVKEISTKKT